VTVHCWLHGASRPLCATPVPRGPSLLAHRPRDLCEPCKTAHNVRAHSYLEGK